MAVDMRRLAKDLAAETADLRALLAPLDEPGWRRVTPAPGWTVLDQVAHLAHFDEATVRAVTEPDAIRADLERAGTIDPDAVATLCRSRTGRRSWPGSTTPELN